MNNSIVGVTFETLASLRLCNLTLQALINWLELLFAHADLALNTYWFAIDDAQARIF